MTTEYTLMDKKKELILNTALQLFLNNGISEVSMNDIAKESSVGRATIYRYFENRHEIVFLLATKMMREIYDTAFADVQFNTSNSIAIGYKNMILRFNELLPAYKYIAMFDAIYTDNFPSDKLSKLYSNQFSTFIEMMIKNLTEKEVVRHIMVLNLIMDFLEDLALHKNIIPQTQSISIQTLLDEFLGTIDALLYIE